MESRDANCSEDICERWLVVCRYAEYRHRSSFPGELSCLSSYSGRERKMRPGPAEAVEPGWAMPHFRPIGLGFSGPGRILG